MTDSIKTMDKPSPSVDPDQIALAWRCLIVGGVSSFAGMSALLRTGHVPTRFTFIAAVTNSFCLGVAIMCGIYWQLGPVITTKHLALAVMLSISSGLGGTSFIDFIVGLSKVWLRSWALKEMKSGKKDE